MMKTDTNDYLSILQKYWGYTSFRGIQKEIIESIGQGRDTLGLMPTGGGKSITFQVPALAMPGLCLVITPLIALMKDQVDHLRELGIKSVAIHSGLSHEQIVTQLENCIFGNVKLLYVSPERLQSDLFLTKLRHMQVSFITVDEAHCISQWGYDFRPAYLQIANIRQLLPHCPILALTATATPRVTEDIQHQLQFSLPNIFRMSFERKNLSYIVQQSEDKGQELLSTLRSTEGSAIVYTRNRDRTREVARWLTENGITALHYHAGLDHTDKDLRQNLWQKGEVRVIVATNAFGMGIDKADVRHVFHLDVPSSPEAYFQEAGRAGRDGKPAWAILLYNKSDRLKLLKRINETFPEKEYIRRVYEDLACFYQMAVGDGHGVTREFNEQEFCSVFKYFPVPLQSALHILTRAGYLEYREEDEGTSRIMILLQKDELYRLQHLPRKTDLLLQTILRLYGGVFSQYVNIEERYLSLQTGLDQETIYTTLKALNQQRILHYIPRKLIPHITYTTRRVETKELFLPPNVYDDRKREFKERIDAMLLYAENQDKCRSRVLLQYFGEHQFHDCGTCDICKPQHTGNSADNDFIMQAIIGLLSDGKPHTIQELRHLPYPAHQVGIALQCLVNEDEISIHDNRLTLN